MRMRIELNKGKTCGTGEEFSGIDMFIAVIKHEECQARRGTDPTA